MADMVEIKAATRDTTNKIALRAMRKDGIIPAIVYGGTEKPLNVALERKVVWQQLQTGHFLSTVYMLDIGGKKTRVIPRAIQLDPVRDFPLHVDFMRVSKSSRIDVEVQVHFVDEEKAPGLKRGGVLNVVRHTVELSCPADSIPESIEISVAGLDIGDAIHISSVKLPANVTPSIDRDFTIATIVGSSAMTSEESQSADAEGDNE